MGKIVAACGVSHILMSPHGCEASAQNIVDGFKTLGEKLLAAKPDVVIVISSDHMFNIDLAMQPRFVIGMSDQYTPVGDMDIPRIPVAGHRALAEAIVKQADQDGFDLCQAEEYALDHGVMVPLLFMGLSHLPIVPLIVNINTQPMPSALRCLALGETLRQAVETSLPVATRVAVVGGGGLSHWLCVPRHGEVDEVFDRYTMDKLCNGGQATLAQAGNADIIERGGNGGIEIVNWLMAAQAAHSSGGEKIFYEPMRSWFTGLGGVLYHVN